MDEFNLNIGSNLLETIFGDDLSKITSSPRLNIIPDPDITKDTSDENYAILDYNKSYYKTVDIINFSQCDCCCKNKYIVDLSKYYRTKVTDGLLKICTSCIERVELILIRNTHKYITYTDYLIYDLFGSHLDRICLTCIIPAVFGTKVRYIPVDHQVINNLLKRYTKNHVTVSMKKQEFLDHIYRTSKCVSCNKIKEDQDRIKIYDTLNYVCKDCNNICRKERIRVNEFACSSYNLDIFIDYNKLHMRCYQHDDNHIWIYTQIILDSKISEIMPICSHCYLAMIKNPRRIF